jgi:glycosyltransferase involved in cell wall biosynthesis
MKISIVLPNFNGARTLSSAIDSFLQQTGEFELVIVDGKSQDESHEIIAAYERSHDRVKWIRESDIGISDAVNKAIPHTSGEIIGYLGGDDLLMPDILKRVAALASMVDFDAIFFNSYSNWIKERRIRLQKPKVTELSRDNLLAHGTIVGLQNIFYRRDILSAHKLDVSNRYSMDYELHLRLSDLGLKMMYVDEVATINNFDGNLTHNNPRQVEEAIGVGLRYSGGYSGPFWFDGLLEKSVVDTLRRNIGAL